MKRRWLSLALSLFGVAALMVVLLSAFRAAEPSSQGKPIRYWIDQLQGNRWQQADDAIREIGPPAAPWLVNRIRAEHSGWRRITRAVLEKLPAQVQLKLRPAQPFDELRLWNAIAGLGPGAAVAESQLKRLLHCSNQPTRTDAAFALWRITADPKYVELLLGRRSDVIFRLSGSAAVPGLERALVSTNAQVREIAVKSLAFTGTAAGPAAPAIAKLLQDPDRNVRLASAAALRQIGPNRRQAIAPLVQVLKAEDHDDEFKEAVVDVLALIGPEAHGAEPELLALIQRPDCRPSTREHAAAALSQISSNTAGLNFLLAELEQCTNTWTKQTTPGFSNGAELRAERELVARCIKVLNRLRDMGLSAKPAAPRILNLIQNPDLARLNGTRTKLLNDSIDAVAAVSADPEVEVPVMAKLLSDADGDVRLKAVLELVRLGPNAVQAIPELESVLKNSAGYADVVTGCAAEALGKIGPHARASVPTLQNLLAHTNSEVRLEASIALWRITEGTNLFERVLGEFESASDTKTRTRLVEVLGEMGPAAGAAVPVVLSRMTYLSRRVRDALEKMDPQALANSNATPK